METDATFCTSPNANPINLKPLSPSPNFKTLESTSSKSTTKKALNPDSPSCSNESPPNRNSSMTLHLEILIDIYESQYI